jgi:hypothetical protein
LLARFLYSLPQSLVGRRQPEPVNLGETGQLRNR